MISFFERSSFKLRRETVIGTALCYSHQACCLVYIWAKLTGHAFTCTSLPLNFNTSVFGCGCGFRFEQKFWRIDGFGGKNMVRRICWKKGIAFERRHISGGNTSAFAG